MESFIVALVILAIVGLAAGYVYREKRKGVKCVGCPYAKECAAKRSSCGCGNHCNTICFSKEGLQRRRSSFVCERE